MAAARTAETVWEGNLLQGKGTVTLKSSGAAPALPVTWASRVERADGRTSPEELLAASQASCYAMAFSHTLAGDGTPPTRLDVTAVCTADQVGGGLKVLTMDITVHGQVPGLDQVKFEDAARRAEQGCPIANAIRGNVEIRVTATLDQ